MSLKLLTYEDFTLPYRQYGQGKEVFIAFHGFGRTGTDFKVFEQVKKQDWTIYAFDWFFHNDLAKYPDHRIQKNAITKREFSFMLKSFIQSLGVSKVGLMAHSMGGKYAMSSVEEIPELISSVYLFAADGMRINFWNHVAVRSKWGRKLFKIAIQKPRSAIQLANFLRKFKLLNSKTHAVSVQPLQTREKRLQVYHTWTSSLNLFPNAKRFVHQVKKHQIDLIAFYGERDQIIRLKDVPKWVDEFETDIIYPIKAGHILLKEKHVDQILERINR